MSEKKIIFQELKDQEKALRAIYSVIAPEIADTQFVSISTGFEKRIQGKLDKTILEWYNRAKKGIMQCRDSIESQWVIESIAKTRKTLIALSALCVLLGYYDISPTGVTIFGFVWKNPSEVGQALQTGLLLAVSYFLLRYLLIATYSGLSWRKKFVDLSKNTTKILESYRKELYNAYPQKFERDPHYIRRNLFQRIELDQQSKEKFKEIYDKQVQLALERNLLRDKRNQLKRKILLARLRGETIFIIEFGLPIVIAFLGVVLLLFT